MTEKLCSRCLVVKPIEFFYRNSHNKSGRNGVCRDCIRAVARAKYASRDPQERKNYQNQCNRKRKEKRAAWYQIHKVKLRAQGDEHYKASQEKWRRRELMRIFGITLEFYNEMLEKQNGKCSICKRPERVVHKKTKRVKVLSVDHCHKTGKIRGLLCSSCNMAIGLLSDSVEFLQNAIYHITKP